MNRMKESFSPLISFCEGKVSTTWLWDQVRIKKNSKFSLKYLCQGVRGVML